MKKIFIILTLIISSIFVISCTKSQPETDKLNEYISTYQTALYVSSSDDMEISITTIYQESPLSLDGKVGKLKKENKLSIKPLKSSFLNYEYEYTLFGSSGEIKGSLQKNLLGVAFYADVEDFEKIGTPTQVNIKFDNKSVDFILEDILIDSNTNYLTALKKAYDTFKEDLSPLITSNKFDREIYIKLVKDNKNVDSSFYWYVSFMKSSKEYHSALITLDGEVKNTRIKP